jgi:TonB family protein
MLSCDGRFAAPVSICNHQNARPLAYHQWNCIARRIQGFPLAASCFSAGSGRDLCVCCSAGVPAIVFSIAVEIYTKVILNSGAQHGDAVMTRLAVWGWALLLVGVTQASAQTPPPLPPFMQPPPNAANQCGRTGPTFLRPVASTHTIAPFPPGAAKNREQGRVTLLVIVDGDGNSREVTVAKSSGYPDLDDAAIASVKDNWKWQKPLPECADMGVVVPVFYLWTLYGAPQ